MRALGQHSLIEFYDCHPDRLKRARAVRTLLCESVRAGGGTIVKAVFHNFSPHGVSGVVVIAESHVTIHTWPEHGYAAADVFSCSPKLKHDVIRRRLKQALGARRMSWRSFRRGLPGKGAKGQVSGARSRTS
jgi:S-adenosylmethionine decarboxylase